MLLAATTLPAQQNFCPAFAAGGFCLPPSRSLRTELGLWTFSPDILSLSQNASDGKSPNVSNMLSPNASSEQNTAGQKKKEEENGHGSKRILGLVPNHNAVSASATPPRLTAKGKLMMATKDSFDYSSLLLAGVVAGFNMGTNSYPSFHSGAAGYGRYYWHAYADEVMGNYFVEGVVPIAARQDPRYYVLGKGSFLHRTGYAISRAVWSRSDSGKGEFNISEVGGNALAVGLSNFYYPPAERTWGTNWERIGTGVGLDTVANFAREFWPDIQRRVHIRRPAPGPPPGSDGASQP